MYDNTPFIIQGEENYRKFLEGCKEHNSTKALEKFDSRKKHDKEIRNKTIDEFAKLLKDKALKGKPLSDTDYGYITYGEVEKVADQLKGGGNSESSS